MHTLIRNRVDLNSSYYSLIGAVIKLAIEDYKSLMQRNTGTGMTNNARSVYSSDAREFLFTNRLEEFLSYSGIDEMVNTRLIRKEASGG